jgi:hypothetical protein
MLQMSLREVLACASCVFAYGAVSARGDQIFTAPRTEHGHPDLQVSWTNPSLTPLTRSPELGNKKNYPLDGITALEAAVVERNRIERLPSDPNRGTPPVGDQIIQQADINFGVAPLNFVSVNGEYPTSLSINFKKQYKFRGYI